MWFLIEICKFPSLVSCILTLSLQTIRKIAWVIPLPSPTPFSKSKSVPTSLKYFKSNVCHMCYEICMGNVKIFCIYNMYSLLCYFLLFVIRKFLLFYMKFNAVTWQWYIRSNESLNCFCLFIRINLISTSAMLYLPLLRLV